MTNRRTCSAGNLAGDKKGKSLSLKQETESLFIAAEDQALRTKYRKANIEKSAHGPKCRPYKQRDETVSHLVSE